MTTIDDHLQALVGQEEIPEAALVALVERIDEAAPPLRDVVAKAAGGTRLSDDEAALFFFGLHVLAAGRDTATFPLLLRFLRRPRAELDDLLGAAAGLTLPRVCASIFDGDTEALLAAILDPKVEGEIRDALLGAAIFLTFMERIPLDRMRSFLVAFEETPAAPAGDLAWIGWVQAVALLGQRDLMPRVVRVFAQKRMPEDTIDLRQVEEELRDAERAPTDGERFDAANLGYVDDVVETMRWLEEIEAQDAGEPVLNPNRDVGRNDPCPCGSGKKFKKCCLAAA